MTLFDILLYNIYLFALLSYWYYGGFKEKDLIPDFQKFSVC